MHLIMILAALGWAWWHRSRMLPQQGSWIQRWQRSLSLFLLPPLLLTMTFLAVLYMGPEDEPMFWQWQGRLSYLLASGFCGFAVVFWLRLASQSWRSLQQVRTCPRLDLIGNSRVLNNPIPFSALIGFWQPELLVSQGLLDTLDRAHLEAVLKHEQGHYYYQDTFWFFWLGWVRSYTAWLPHTEALWQELLLLREIRADRWAAQQVDPLLLAESLLVVVGTLPVQSDNCCAAFSCAVPRSRLQERIEALLADSELISQPSLWSWTWLLLAFLPLASVPFHNCSHLSAIH